MPYLKIKYTPGEPTIMSFNGSGADRLILPKHSTVNDINGVPLESISILKDHGSSGVSVILITYPPGDYNDVVEVVDVYMKANEPIRLYLLILRNNGQTSEIKITENIGRPPCNHKVI
jgi:hypothetical protein